MVRKIFLNYRRDDSAPSAVAIAAYLERAFGASNVYLDVDRLRAGQHFPRELEKRLAACKVMICVIGPGWLDALDEVGQRRLDNPKDWVRLEIERALARSITVIPVLVSGATLPKDVDLPVTLRSLVDRHAAVITTNGFRNDMTGLVEDIRAIPSQRSWAWIAGAAAIVAFVGIIVLTLNHGVPTSAISGSVAPTKLEIKKATAAASASSSVKRSTSIPITTCDKLAAADYDAMARANAVYFEDILGADAVAACREALMLYPLEPRLLFQLGRALLRIDMPMDALQAFQQAVDAGYVAANLSLARMFEIGNGTTKELAKARAYLERATVGGNTSAIVELAKYYRNGLGVPRDLAKTIDFLRQAVAQGSPVAMNELGWHYRDGIGVVRDEKQAIAWFQKAADQGNLWAMRNLGNLYEKGQGVAKDCKTATAWYAKAAVSNHTDAKTLLAALARNCA